MRYLVESSNISSIKNQGISKRFGVILSQRKRPQRWMRPQACPAVDLGRTLESTGELNKQNHNMELMPDFASRDSGVWPWHRNF